MAGPGSVLYKPVDFRGPTCLAAGNPDSQADPMIGELIAGYSREEKHRYQIRKQVLGGEESGFFVEQRMCKETAARFQIGG
jgi:hypothetical protein